MASRGEARCTLDEYFAIERTCEWKREYIDGRIVEMPSVCVRHVTITGNIFVGLRSHHADRVGDTFVSQMRVQVEDGRRYVYPDVIVVLEESRCRDEERDTLLNPALIVEVLSPASEAYDRGEKFLHYRKMPSLQEYAIVSQHRVLVETFVREGEMWKLFTYEDFDSSVEFRSVECLIPMREIYEDVEFPAPPHAGKDDPA